MSLHARFLLLLGILGAAVIANIAVTVWSVGLLDREQRWPAEQIGSVLGVLNGVKRTLWDQAGEVGFFVAPGGGVEPGMGEAGSTARFRRFGERALEQLDGLTAVESYAVRSGTGTIRNLRSRIQSVNAVGEQYLATGDDASRDTVLAEFYMLHELIERTEARLIEDARIAASYAERVRRRLTTTLVGSVTTVLLALAVAGWLFRRWVIIRIDGLRLAAEEIGAGNFDYRVEAPGPDELDRVGRQINQMTTTIVEMQTERIERERLAVIGEMARRLAHNIRNPLGGIRSLAELSVHEARADDPVCEHQRRIIHTVDHFSKWLNDLLSVSNPMSMQPAHHQVEPWLRDLVESHRPMAESRSVRLVLDTSRCPASASFDRGHLEHAVSALITNAIELSPRGAQVGVEATPGSEAGAWRISVTDQGPGIAEAHFGSLFTPYFTTKKGGTGIGIAQAKRVVIQHGGEIWAENRADRGDSETGAAFTLEIPLAPGEESARIGQHGEANRGQNPGNRGR